MMAAGQLSCVSEQQKHSSALWKPLEEVQNLVYLAGSGGCFIIIITINSFLSTTLVPFYLNLHLTSVLIK